MHQARGLQFQPVLIIIVSAITTNDTTRIEANLQNVLKYSTKHNLYSDYISSVRLLLVHQVGSPPTGESTTEQECHSSLWYSAQGRTYIPPNWAWIDYAEP